MRKIKLKKLRMENFKGCQGCSDGKEPYVAEN